MKRIALFAGGGVALVGAALLVVSTQSADVDRIILRDSDPETVERGRAVYAANCASCHGADLQGQPNWRSPDEDGRLPAPPHDETGHTWHHDSHTLLRLTKYGTGALIGNPDYASNMPIYEGILSDDEIIAVLSYIKSTWPKDVRARHDEIENRQ